MKHILVIDLERGETTHNVSFADQDIEIKRIGSDGDVECARQLIAQYDGAVDVIALEGMSAQLKLGSTTHPFEPGAQLRAAAKQTPVVDGAGVRDGLERWAVMLANRAQPGIFAEKFVLMVPGVNHSGLADELAKHSPVLRYADPFVFFNLPDFPGVGSKQTLEQAAVPTLERLARLPFKRVHALAGTPHAHRAASPFQHADVLAGDIGAIRRYAPHELKRKTIVVEYATEQDVADLKTRGASIVVTLMPGVPQKGQRGERGALGNLPASVMEAIFVACRANTDLPMNENTYLDLMANLDWTPHIRYLRPEEAGVNKFAFVIHPLQVDFIRKHKMLKWTKYLPDDLVETTAAYFPPLYLSKITGAQSPTTGQRVEGYLYSLGATPRQMMQRGEKFTYMRLNQAARMAERKGARIMGLGAFTSVVGDAGITVANEADIAITSGNSLTVAATLEAAKQAVIQMGATDLTRGKVMIVGATGSIGSVCARLLAQAIRDVVLVSIEPAKLIELKRTIQAETPDAQVTIALHPNELLGECDLIVTATSAFGQRVVDITQCKPGAVICDVARPPDIGAAEAALRPDVLVIESGEVLIPGDIDFGYDIGLPPKTSYACLAETCLLAMEGRFEDYTLGRNIEMERVKEIYRLFKKHDFKLAGLRSHGEYITEADVARKRALAEELRSSPQKFAQVKRETALQLAKIPASSKGVRASKGTWKKWLAIAAGAGIIGAFAWRTQRSRPSR
ncbi:MAG: serine carboxypeptidase [Chloroflexota bacterium]|nr:MAG: serine carboxypeptidase [Chloroflexota bacterium]